MLYIVTFLSFQRALVTIVFCATFQLSAGERKDKPTYPPCDENQWLDITHDPPMCFPCTTCTGCKCFNCTFFGDVSRIGGSNTNPVKSCGKKLNEKHPKYLRILSLQMKNIRFESAASPTTRFAHSVEKGRFGRQQNSNARSVECVPLTTR